MTTRLARRSDAEVLTFAQTTLLKFEQARVLVDACDGDMTIARGAYNIYATGSLPSLGDVIVSIRRLIDSERIHVVL